MLSTSASRSICCRRGGEMSDTTNRTQPATDYMELTTHDLIERFLTSRAETCNVASQTTYRASLVAFERWLGDQPLSADTIRAYLAQRAADGRAEETRRGDYRMLKTMCRWLVDEDLLITNPFAGRGRVKPIKRTRQYRTVYTDTDIIKLLTATKPIYYTKRDLLRMRQQWKPDGPMEREETQGRALVVLLVDSALRAAEACSLNCGDIRAEVHMVTGKGGHRLPFYLSSSAVQVIMELVNDRPDDAPLFLDRVNKRCTTRALRGTLMRLARRANVTLPARPLHSFRHYCARSWKAAGLADMVIMDMMRHSQIESTRHYTGGPDVANLTRQHMSASPIAPCLCRPGWCDRRTHKLLRQ
jgi:site-specific recombinase XerD